MAKGKFVVKGTSKHHEPKKAKKSKHRRHPKKMKK